MDDGEKIFRWAGILVFLGVLLAVFLLVIKTPTPEPELGAVAKIEKELKGKKRYLAYSRVAMIKGYSAFNHDSLDERFKAARIKDFKQREGIFYFDATPEQIRNFKNTVTSFASDDNGGVVVQEDRIYSIEFGCERDPVPGPTPKPNPDPKPTPNPGGPIKDKLPWGVYKIEAHKAVRITDASDIMVCVVDTGLDRNHPDLMPMIVGGVSMVQGENSYEDLQGHGTHVAGTIAAQFNSIGVRGVSQAKLYGVKVLDKDGRGYTSWIAKGMRACVDAGAKVLNMSLGSPAKYGTDQLMRDTVQYVRSKGAYIVAAAGNDGKGVGYPAAIPGVIAVSALDSQDRLANFSSRGPEINFAAPGVNIQSLKMGGGETVMSGTSMAAPHVAGVMALALSAGKKDMKADDIGLSKSHQGKGRVNALKSVQ